MATAVRPTTDEELAAERICDWAARELRRRFPDLPNIDPLYYWPYHCFDHSAAVNRRREVLADDVRRLAPELYTARDNAVGSVGAVLHDLYQHGERVEINGAIKRVRPTGLSEIATAGAAAEQVLSHRAFRLSDAASVGQSIIATTAVYDQKYKTVVHPYLTVRSSINDVLLALSDVNTAGVEGHQSLWRDCIDLFKEDNLDFLSWWLSGQWPTDTEPLRQRMISWIQVQIDFTTGRRDRLETELGLLPDGIGLELMPRFKHFDSAIAATEGLLADARGMSFVELREFYGYYQIGGKPPRV